MSHRAQKGKSFPPFWRRLSPVPQDQKVTKEITRLRKFHKSKILQTILSDSAKVPLSIPSTFASIRKYVVVSNMCLEGESLKSNLTLQSTELNILNLLLNHPVGIAEKRNLPTLLLGIPSQRK